MVPVGVFFLTHSHRFFESEAALKHHSFSSSLDPSWSEELNVGTKSSQFARNLLWLPKANNRKMEQLTLSISMVNSLNGYSSQAPMHPHVKPLERLHITAVWPHFIYEKVPDALINLCYLSQRRYEIQTGISVSSRKKHIFTHPPSGLTAFTHVFSSKKGPSNGSLRGSLRATAGIQRRSSQPKKFALTSWISLEPLKRRSDATSGWSFAIVWGRKRSFFVWRVLGLDEFSFGRFLWV